MGSATVVPIEDGFAPRGHLATGVESIFDGHALGSGGRAWHLLCRGRDALTQWAPPQSHVPQCEQSETGPVEQKPANEHHLEISFSRILLGPSTPSDSTS